ALDGCQLKRGALGSGRLPCQLVKLVGGLVVKPGLKDSAGEGELRLRRLRDAASLVPVGKRARESLRRAPLRFFRARARDGGLGRPRNDQSRQEKCKRSHILSSEQEGHAERDRVRPVPAVFNETPNG